MRKIYHTNMIYSKRESMPDFINYKIQKIISKNSFVFLVFVCAVLFAYGNILFGDFVFDDNIFIVPTNNLFILCFTPSSAFRLLSFIWRHCCFIFLTVF